MKGRVRLVQKPSRSEERRSRLRGDRDAPSSIRSTTSVTRRATSTISKESSARAAPRQGLGVVRKVPRATHMLIRGGTGTGKSLAAESPTRSCSGNFIKVTRREQGTARVGALRPRKGHSPAPKQRIGRSSTTRGGKLFLDEIGDMAPNTQARYCACSRTGYEGSAHAAIRWTCYDCETTGTSAWWSWLVPRDIYSLKGDDREPPAASARTTCGDGGLFIRRFGG